MMIIGKVPLHFKCMSGTFHMILGCLLFSCGLYLLSSVFCPWAVFSLSIRKLYYRQNFYSLLFDNSESFYRIGQIYHAILDDVLSNIIFNVIYRVFDTSHEGDQ